MTTSKNFASHFTVDQETNLFTVSQRAYLAAHPDPRYSYISTGAAVFSLVNPLCPRLLLLQRSAHDSMPGKWEVPGGGCDDDDESIVHGAARELWEEAGLRAAHISTCIGGPHLFSTKSGKKIGQFIFIIKAEAGAQGQLEVNLDPKEHQSFAWATEGEIRSKKVGDIALEFTRGDLEQTLLTAFRHFKEE